MKLLKELKERVIRVATRTPYKWNPTTTGSVLNLPVNVLKNFGRVDEVDIYGVAGEDNRDILILHLRQKEKQPEGEC